MTFQSLLYLNFIGVKLVYFCRCYRISFNSISDWLKFPRKCSLSWPRKFYLRCMNLFLSFRHKSCYPWFQQEQCLHKCLNIFGCPRSPWSVPGGRLASSLVQPIIPSQRQYPFHRRKTCCPRANRPCVRLKWTWKALSKPEWQYRYAEKEKMRTC